MPELLGQDSEMKNPIKNTWQWFVTQNSFIKSTFFGFALILVAVPLIVGLKNNQSFHPFAAEPSSQTHLIVAYNLITSQDIGKAAEGGINTTYLNFPDTNYSGLQSAVKSSQMGEIDNVIGNLVNAYYCHQVLTNYPPPANSPYCTTELDKTMVDENVLYQKVASYLQKAKQNSLIKRFTIMSGGAPYWMEDGDVAQKGQNVLTCIHSEIYYAYTHNNPMPTPTTPGVCPVQTPSSANPAVPPTICEYDGYLNSDKTINWDSKKANVYSPDACDYLMLGVNQLAVVPNTTITADSFDWSMSNMLPTMLSDFRSKGWNNTKNPLMGMVSVFGGTLGNGKMYYTPTAKNIETQTRSFCSMGATDLVFYSWHIGFLQNLQYPLNNTDIQTGIRNGIADCQNEWNSSIWKENQNAGIDPNTSNNDANWVIHTSNDATGQQSYSLNGIEGYASKTSVAPGETIDFMVRNRQFEPAPTPVDNSIGGAFKAHIYRLGWYGGDGARMMSINGQTTWNGTGCSFTECPIPTANPPAPNIINAGGSTKIDYSNGYTGLLEAHWPTKFSIVIPDDWPSGIYLVKLIDTTRPNHNERYIQFTVKEKQPTSKLVFVHAAATNQAYNQWGGKSLYNGINPPQGITVKANAAVKVSFNRPYDGENGAGEVLGQEYAMIRYLERYGYDVSYITDTDVNENSSLLSGRKGIIIVGHDEYWSKNMRTNLDNAVANGVNLANFGANNGFWHIRFENADLLPSVTPSPGQNMSDRTIVTYREAQYDPLFNKSDNTDITDQWRMADLLPSPIPTYANAEQGLLGAMYPFNGGAISDYYQKTVFPLTVQGASNIATSWIFANTNLKNGDQVQGLLGREVDSLGNTVDFKPYHPAAPNNVVIVGDANVPQSVGISSATTGTCNSTGQNCRTIHVQSSFYTAPSGARVFNGSSIWWPLALDDFNTPSSNTQFVQRSPNLNAEIITRNILDNFVYGSSSTSQTNSVNAPQAATAPLQIVQPQTTDDQVDPVENEDTLNQ